MGYIKKYDGTTFNNVYSVHHYDGTRLNHKNIKPFNFDVMYLDGAGDCVVIPYSNDQNFGNGNFTLEAQIYLLNTPGSSGTAILSCQAGSGGIDYARPQSLGVGAAREVFLSLNDAAVVLTNSIILDLNKQYHIAAVRNGNDIRVYKDGTSVLNTTNSVTLNTTACPASIGRYYYNYDGYYLNAYLANVRVSKGVARYTSTFTPSKEILAVDSYTKLQINGTSPLSDSAGKSLTVNGNTTSMKQYSIISSDISNVLYFDGAGDYLYVGDSADQNFGSGNFTIDCQVKLTSNPGKDVCLIGNRQSSTGWMFFVGTSLVFYNDGVGQAPYSGAMSIGSQHHVAFVQESQKLNYFIDGTKYTTTFNPSITSAGAQYIGRSYYSGVADFPGYMANLRVSKGIARYTSNFTPVRTRGTVDQYTKLLITGTSPISDKTGKTVTVYGNTTSVKIAI